MGKADETRARILVAAMRRIAAEGVDGVRIARIAMDAGVSAALVHYHFESRDALLVEALEHSFTAAGDTRERSTEGTAMERLERIVDSSLPNAAERDDFLLWVELWLRASRQPELRETAARLYQRMHEWVAPVLAEMGVENVPRATDHILAMLDGYGVRALFGDPAMPVERARAEILHVASTLSARGGR